MTANQTRMRVLLLLLALLLLAACGTGVKPDSTTTAPDGTTTTKAPGETTDPPASTTDEENDWPFHLLPENVPEAERAYIQKVDIQTNGNISILMYAEYENLANYLTILPNEYGYVDAFAMNVVLNDPLGVDSKDWPMFARFAHRDGTVLRIGWREYGTPLYNGRESYLDKAFQEYGEGTGFLYEIIYIRGELHPNFFLKFPVAATDLGLAEMQFDDWPSAYLPEDFPQPPEELTILSMEQKKNGVFITMKGDKFIHVDYSRTLRLTYDYEDNPDGSYTIVSNCNLNKDYYFCDEIEREGDSRTLMYQIVRYSDAAMHIKPRYAE